MASDLWNELTGAIGKQLDPHGYCGHLLKHFDTKKTHLENIIKRTALMSESNSVLIIGPHGSGKSALLECVLGKVLEDPVIHKNMLRVELDGMLHVDDNIALDDIAEQLKIRQEEDRPLGSFSEKLRLLLATLRSGSKESKSVLFILDNFELFASHKNQTLLYNLFDIAQSRQTPICIVGLCSGPDVINVLENRVKSRFSHQQILLNEDYTLEEYADSAKYYLTLHSFKDSRFQKRWNAEVASLLKEKSVKDIIEHHYNYNDTLRDLKDLLYYVFLDVDSTQPKLFSENFSKAQKKFYENPKANLILDLSILEIAIVITMSHLTEIYDGEPFNFEIIFNELGKFFRNRMKWNIEKAVVRKSFEYLLDLELVKSCHDSYSDSLKNFMPVKLMVSPFEIRSALEKYPNLPAEIKHWIESF